MKIEDVAALPESASPVTILLDRWPETEAQLEAFIGVLRHEFRCERTTPLKFLKYHDFGGNRDCE